MKQHYPYLDILRVFSILGVILIHLCVPLITDVPAHTNSWWVGIIYTSIVRPCVPLFFMISGALLLGSRKQESPFSFLSNRATKVLIPFIIFNFLYAYLAAQMQQQPYTTILIKSLSGSIFYHLWFMYILINLYLLTPLLQLMVKHAQRIHFHYFFILWFFATAINPLIDRFTGIDTSIFFTNLTGYLGYFILGYYLHRFTLPSSIKNYAVRIGLLALPLAILLTGLSSTSATDLFYIENLSILMILYTSSLFLIFKQLPTLQSLNQLITTSQISQTVLYIYLIHPIVIFGLREKLGLSITSFSPVVAVPLMSILTLVCSYLIARIILTFLSHISPKAVS